MASHSGDGSPKEPVASADRRVPLSTVVFREPTAIPGSTTMFTTLEAGVPRLVDGKEWLAPDMWLDKELRVIKIGRRAYPLERVHYYDHAFAKVTKRASLDLAKFTIGKVAK